MAKKKTTKKEVDTSKTASEVLNVAEPQVPAGKVLVNEEALQKLMSRVETMEKELEATADKNKLNRYRDSLAPKGGMTVRLGVIDGEVIVGWTTMPTNWCEKQPTGHYAEKQERILIMASGEEKRIDYSVANKKITYIDADVVSKTQKGDTTILHVAAENGKEYDIDTKFIN